MSFSTRWHTLLEECEALPEDATLVTPLSADRFHITDVQEHPIIIEGVDSSDSRPLQRDQFETLYRRIMGATDGFDLDRLPPDADPYPTVLSLHPRFEVDERAQSLPLTDRPPHNSLIRPMLPPVVVRRSGLNRRGWLSTGTRCVDRRAGTPRPIGS